MIISELIAKLETLKAEHGDIQVRSYDDEGEEGKVQQVRFYKSSAGLPVHVEISHNPEV